MSIEAVCIRPICAASHRDRAISLSRTTGTNALCEKVAKPRLNSGKLAAPSCFCAAASCISDSPPQKFTMGWQSFTHSGSMQWVGPACWETNSRGAARPTSAAAAAAPESVESDHTASAHRPSKL
eukprot:7087441-Prymnesium_polylepis.2